MSTKDLERVIELWPSLSDEARADVVELAEASQQPAMRPLTRYELDMLERSREDFKHGRFMNADEYYQHMQEFLRELAAKAAP
jgi:hypothetical protein